jgi:5-methylcytosine-specific restriction endonuclease McrA
VYCGSTTGLRVHHVRHAAHGGSNEDGNLVTLCAACHRATHNRPG